MIGRLILAVPLAWSLLAPTSTPDARAIVGDGLRDMQGRVWTTSTLAGRVVVVDFWATWCAPCLAEIPTLRELTAAHREDLVVLGISLDTMPRRDFVSWLSRRDVNWPQHFDGRGYSGPAATRLNLSSLPASYLVDRDGRVVARNLRGQQLRDAVRALVSERQLPGAARK